MAEILEIAVDARGAQEGFRQFEQSADRADAAVGDLGRKLGALERDLDETGDEARSAGREVQRFGDQAQRAEQQAAASGRGVASLGGAYNTAKLGVDKFNEALGVFTGGLAAGALAIELIRYFSESEEAVDGFTDALDRSRQSAEALRDVFRDLAGATILDELDERADGLSAVAQALRARRRQFLGSQAISGNAVLSRDEVDAISSASQRQGLGGVGTETLFQIQRRELVRLIEEATNGPRFDSGRFQGLLRERGLSLDAVLGERGTGSGLIDSDTQSLRAILESTAGISPVQQLNVIRRLLPGAEIQGLSGNTAREFLGDQIDRFSSAARSAQGEAEQAGEDIGEAIVRGARRAAGVEVDGLGFFNAAVAGGPNRSPAFLRPRRRLDNVGDFGPQLSPADFQARALAGLDSGPGSSGLDLVPDLGGADGADRKLEDLSRSTEDVINAFGNFAGVLATRTNDVDQALAQLVSEVASAATRELVSGLVGGLAKGAR